MGEGGKEPTEGTKGKKKRGALDYERQRRRTKQHASSSNYECEFIGEKENSAKRETKKGKPERGGKKRRRKKDTMIGKFIPLNLLRGEISTKKKPREKDQLNRF